MFDTVRICPHNVGVDCETPCCKRCGWYPPVEKKRKKALTRLEKYKIPFTGHCEVWAKSPEEALKLADNGEMFYAEYDFGEPATDEEESK